MSIDSLHTKSRKYRENETNRKPKIFWVSMKIGVPPIALYSNSNKVGFPSFVFEWNWMETLNNQKQWKDLNCSDLTFSYINN